MTAVVTNHEQEWRNDLSDVILPLPNYDSDSDSDGEELADASKERAGPLPPWKETPPKRVLELMLSDEKHAHQNRQLHRKPRPEPMTGVASVRHLDADTAAADIDRIVGASNTDGEPVIIEGLAKSWRAAERWSSAEAFVKNYGNMPLKTYDLASVSGMGKTTELWLPASHYAEYATTATADAPFYVFQKKFVDGEHDVLFEDYERPPLFSDDLWDLTPELRSAFPLNRFFCIGGERTGSALHVDPHFTSAWNTLLCGEKRWVLFPPGTDSKEIGVPVTLQDKVATPCSYWWHDWYPKLAAANGPGARLGMREVIQRAGDTIYVPAGWWHTVLNHGWTIAVTENQLAPAMLQRSWQPLKKMNSKLARRLKQALQEFRPELLALLPVCDLEDDASSDGDAEAPTNDADNFRMW